MSAILLTRKCLHSTNVGVKWLNFIKWLTLPAGERLDGEMNKPQECWAGVAALGVLENGSGVSG